MLLSCGVGEDSLESLGPQGDPTSPSILKEISPVCSLEGLMPFMSVSWFTYLDTPPLGVGEGNGTPLQYSCLENPVDRGAW